MQLIKFSEMVHNRYMDLVGKEGIILLDEDYHGKEDKSDDDKMEGEEKEEVEVGGGKGMEKTVEYDNDVGKKEHGEDNDKLCHVTL